jgi:hypothetical protein
VTYTLLPELPRGWNESQPHTERNYIGAFIYKNVSGLGNVCQGYTTPYVFAKTLVQWLNQGVISMQNVRNVTAPQRAQANAPAQAPAYGPTMSAEDAHHFAEQITREVELNVNANLWDILQRFHAENNVQLEYEMLLKIQARVGNTMLPPAQQP